MVKPATDSGYEKSLSCVDKLHTICLVLVLHEQEWLKTEPFQLIKGNSPTGSFTYVVVNVAVEVDVWTDRTSVQRRTERAKDNNTHSIRQ